METIPQMVQALQTTMTAAADQIGAAVRFNTRPDLAKFTPSTFVQTLVFGWLAHPDARLEQLAQMAARVGVDVSAQAIDQRFTPTSAALLQGVLAAAVPQVVASTGPPSPSCSASPACSCRTARRLCCPMPWQPSTLGVAAAPPTAPKPR